MACAVLAAVGTVAAQTPVAADDDFAAESGILLEVEDPGVLENDHDGMGEPPPPPTAVAHLESDVTHGDLVLSGDGSFTYTSDQGFVGDDVFTYSFTDGPATSNTATVTITVDGCEPGAAPTQWVCWVEQAYLDKAAELGLTVLVEGFEDDLDWAAARSPETAPTVTSQGVSWASNFASNEITTGNGPVRSGAWAMYSLPHGDPIGAPTDQIFDGFTGTAASADGLLGVGGWVKASQVGSRLDLIVTHDGGATTTAPFRDHSLTIDHLFFGFIDTAGFTSFEVVETDGTVNQPYFIFGDDFSILVGQSVTIWYVAPNGNDINDCETTSMPCLTISEVISRAVSGDRVYVARGSYNEHLVLGVDLTLVGEMPMGTVINGGGTGTVVSISPAITVTIQGFEIRGGGTGGISNDGNLVLKDSWIHTNGDGSPSSFGGLANQGTALLDRIAVADNIGASAGAVTNSGQLEVRNSTISGNTGGNGIGVGNLPGGFLALVYSTVSANGNLGVSVGDPGSTSLRGTIITGHATANCDGVVVTLGYNLEDGNSCGFQPASNDLIGVDPLLIPIGHHGGSSPTHAIDVGSPALDAGESAGGPASDQRGVSRPLDGDLSGAAAADIGAFEALPGAIFDDGFESGAAGNWS